MRMQASGLKWKLRSRLISNSGPTASRKVPMSVSMCPSSQLGMYSSLAPIKRSKPLYQVAALPGMDDIGLQRCETASHDLFAQGCDIGPGLDWRGAEQLMMTHPGRAAVRPVEANLAAGGATEQLGDGDTKRFGFDIHAGALHAR